MTLPTRRQLIFIAIGLLIIAAIAFAVRPVPVSVETANVGRGPLQVIIEDEGETRLADRYVISSPVMAYLQRIEAEPGDRVEQGQSLAQLEAPRSPILDPRQRTEASARVATARAIVAQSEATANQAVLERERLARLVEAGAAPRATLEQAAAEAARSLAARNAARTELNAAQETLRRATETPDRPVQDVLRAPASGRILTVLRRDGAVNPGEPLIEVGDTQRLEIVVDVLSQDAVRIVPGTRVLLEQWGGDVPLEAIVRHVEPEGVARVSALGVEERRVNIVADPVKPFPATVGPGYRVLARFVIWEEPNVLQVPSGALFRHEEGWAVFVIENDRAVIRDVAIGQQAGLAAQVVSGLREGDVVIVHPPNEIEAGVRVRPM